MWSDNETDKDFLNFTCVADTAAEMIIQARGRPLSLGVSGGWGVGKSSMLNLISDSLHARGDGKYLFVEFNAWLYQGYDDARAALMEVIAEKLIQHEQQTETGLQKAKSLLKRVNWLRVAGLTAGSALAVSAGLPPVGLLGALRTAWQGLTDGDITSGDVDNAADVVKKAAQEGAGVVKAPEAATPPGQIHELRKLFQETLEEMGVTLVLFIDDLDRCLPATAISTLEAIRLFLFLPHTAFVIAADDRMIRQAVRVHFEGLDLDDDLVTNYFDKLVQVPLRVPPLGTQEVRAYLMLLFIENGGLVESEQERVRGQVCKQLSESWKGQRVDLKFVLSLLGDCPDELRANLRLADRLAPLMTTAKKIGGNPRLIKRFLNTLFIRLAMAQAQNVAVDEGALAKMLLFERCATAKAHAELLAAVNDGDTGKPSFLAEWERRAVAGDPIEDLRDPWDDPFIHDWLALAPAFGDLDLRGVVYVSREHLPIVTSVDQLSSEAAEVLDALMVLDARSPVVRDQLSALPGREVSLVMERLMVRARQEQAWGTPRVLWAILTVFEVDPVHTTEFATFLESVHPTRRQPNVVPVLADQEWAQATLNKWASDPATPDPVKKAISLLSREDDA